VTVWFASTGSFSDSLLWAAIACSCLFVGTVFGFYQAMRGMRARTRGETTRFVRWFAEGSDAADDEVPGWGLMAMVGVWFGGGCVVLVLPVAIVLWLLGLGGGLDAHTLKNGRMASSVEIAFDSASDDRRLTDARCTSEPKDDIYYCTVYKRDPSGRAPMAFYDVRPDESGVLVAVRSKGSSELPARVQIY
jgi:hypothetical protein